MAKKRSMGYKVKSGGKRLDYSVSIAHLYNLDHPIFCFKYLCKKYHIDKCPPKHRADLIERLCKLSELGFKAINKSPRHAYGFEKIKTKSLRFKIPEFISEGIDFLYAYRYNGKNNPFLAYRRPDIAILHVVAIDYNFSAYDHGT